MQNSRTYRSMSSKQEIDKRHKLDRYLRRSQLSQYYNVDLLVTSRVPRVEELQAIVLGVAFDAVVSATWGAGLFARGRVVWCVIVLVMHGSTRWSCVAFRRLPRTKANRCGALGLTFCLKRKASPVTGRLSSEVG